MNSVRTSPARKTRVLIIDDSNVFRLFLRRALTKDARIEVVGSAASAAQARQVLSETEVDVITLDLEMPEETGLEFLQSTLNSLAIPVVVLSGSTPRGAKTAIQALEFGASEVFCKVRGSGAADTDSDELRQLRRTILGLNNVRTPPQKPAGTVSKPKREQSVTPNMPVAHNRTGRKWMIGIGASTGGVQAIEAVLKTMPVDCPPILIVQHMPEGFTAAFAERLNSICSIAVREAVDGDQPQAGTALIAPGGQFHMILEASSQCVRLIEGDPVCYSRPAVDVLFKSLASALGPRVVSIVLTGMGSDGADGSLAIRNAGGKTFAQDEKTSQIYGMPARTWERGGASAQVPLESVTETLLGAVASPASEYPNRRGVAARPA